MDESNKLRLVEPLEMARAIQCLIEDGERADQLLARLMQDFYVDLDVFEEVLTAA